jgi:hypothetical protein
MKSAFYLVGLEKYGTANAEISKEKNINYFKIFFIIWVSGIKLDSE